MSLTGRQRRFLRAQGHALSPIVQIGKEGITEAFIAATSAALEQHELIKVKVGQTAPEDRHDAAEMLAEMTRGEVAQVLGNTILLYRRRHEEPTIELPGASPAAA